MRENESFVFYGSFIDTIELAPENLRYELYKNLSECGCGRKALEDVEFPYSLFVSQAMASVSSAKQRYEKTVESGKTGGRPKKWVDPNVAKALYAEFGTWDKVAKELDVALSTLYLAKSAWERKEKRDSENSENSENLNDNDNGNGNVNDNDNENVININLSNNNKNNPAEVGTRLEAVPPPQDFQWTSKIKELDGVHFRQCQRIGGYEVRIIRLD